MIDANFAAAIARDSTPGADTLTLEIGPGTGCLTRAILDAHPQSRVLAMEIDTGLMELLRTTFSAEIDAGRMTLLEGDALAGKHALSDAFVKEALAISAREHRPRRVLCANLPYNIATPLLANLAADREELGVESAVATVQRELAERLFGAPGSSDYGALTAFMSLRTKGSITRRVGHEIFWPRPQVDSAVVSMTFLPFGDTAGVSGQGSGVSTEPGLLREETQAFQEFLQKLFSQRRKQLRAALKPLVIPKDAGISEIQRAEDLAPDILLRLFRAVQQGDPAASKK